MSKKVNNQTVYLPSHDVPWTELVQEAIKKARQRTGHNEWKLLWVDEYNREVSKYNDHGKEISFHVEAKVVVAPA